MTDLEVRNKIVEALNSKMDRYLPVDGRMYLVDDTDSKTKEFVLPDRTFFDVDEVYEMIDELFKKA